MSLRELKTLSADSCLSTRTRSEKTAMTDTTSMEKLVDELKAQLAGTREELQEKARVATELECVAESTKAEVEEARQAAGSEAARVTRLTQELETATMLGELTKLRACSRKGGRAERNGVEKNAWIRGSKMSRTIIKRRRSSCWPR